MSESTGSSDKSASKSSEPKSKPKDSSSCDASTSKSAESAGDASTSKSAEGAGDASTSKSAESAGDASTSKSAESAGDGDGGKSAKESIGGQTDIHYGFFSSVRTPEYRSGWDDIWGKQDPGQSAKKGAKSRSNANSESKAGARPATANLTLADLPDDIRDGLVEAARRKMRKSRSSYDKLDASGLVDWTISVTVSGRRT